MEEDKIKINGKKLDKIKFEELKQIKQAIDTKIMSERQINKRLSYVRQVKMDWLKTLKKLNKEKSSKGEIIKLLREINKMFEDREDYDKIYSKLNVLEKELIKSKL